MADIKSKVLGPVPRKIKTLIKHVQINVDLDGSLLAKFNKQITEVVSQPPARAPSDRGIRPELFSAQISVDPHSQNIVNDATVFDLEANYSARAIKLAEEMIRGFRAGWSENSSNKREVCIYCLQPFWKERDNQEFCSDECRDVVDAERSRMAMEKRREEKQREKFRLEIVQQNENAFKEFQEFLRIARNNQYEKVGAIIKKRIPGEWKTVNAWLKESDQRTVWDNLSPIIRAIFFGQQRDASKRGRDER